MTEQPYRGWKATVRAPDGTTVEIHATRDEYEAALAATIRQLSTLPLPPTYPDQTTTGRDQP